MFAAFPQPHQVLSTMPRTSPMAQPVRQCQVAVIAILQLSVIPTLYPWGVPDATDVTPASGRGDPEQRFNGAGELPAPPRADHAGRPDPAQPPGDGLDAHGAGGPGPRPAGA